MRILWALPLLFAAQAQTILITQGAADYQVYQRDGRGLAAIAIAGKAFSSEGKTVEARLTGAAAVVQDWRAVATVKQQTWSATLRDVPTGGPYRLEVRVAGSVDLSSASNLLVGDLWVLAGQSNMEGVGNLEGKPAPDPRVNSFDMTDRWVRAEDPLHRLPDAVDRVHWPRVDGQPQKLEGSKLDQWMAARKKGAGVGLPFALEMVQRTGVPIGLLPCAHGGTSMDQWSPALKERGGDSLYGATIRRINAAGGKVKGVLWYQGESDANPKAAPLFEEKFKALIAALRADTGQSDLPFYYVQLGRHLSDANVKEWNFVQDVQRRVEGAVTRTGMVAAGDLRLDDGIHVGTDDHRLLGRRLANLACHDLYPAHAGCAQYRRGPRPVEAVFAGGVVRVTFTEVNGRLTHEGRLAGFSIHGENGAPLPLIYRMRVDPRDGQAVELLISGKMPPNATLHYGYLKDPLLSLRDEAGMGAPVFGPLPIRQ